MLAMSSAYVLIGWRISDNWLIAPTNSPSGGRLTSTFYSSLHRLQRKTLNFPALHCTALHCTALHSTLSLIVLVVTSRDGSHRKHRSSVSVQLFLIRNLLPSSGRCLHSNGSACYNIILPHMSICSQWSLSFWISHHSICIPLHPSPCVLHAILISASLTSSLIIFG
jgi:hypothetical protein